MILARCMISINMKVDIYIFTSARRMIIHILIDLFIYLSVYLFIHLFNIQYIYDSCFEKVLFIKNVFGER